MRELLTHTDINVNHINVDLPILNVFCYKRVRSKKRSPATLGRNVLLLLDYRAHCWVDPEARA